MGGKWGSDRNEIYKPRTDKQKQLNRQTGKHTDTNTDHMHNNTSQNKIQISLQSKDTYK